MGIFCLQPQDIQHGGDGGSGGDVVVVVVVVGFNNRDKSPLAFPAT